MSKMFKFGSGFTWPGHFALKIYPDILNFSKLKFPKGVVLISGTNGKTTTSKLVTHFLSQKGFKVVNNKTGANLLNGIVSQILISCNLLGNHGADIGVFEVDEQNLPIVLKYFKNPKSLILLNLSRDQLDRYGEIDIILDKWRDSISNLKPEVNLVLDETQDYFKTLKGVFKGEVTYFGDNKRYLDYTNLVGGFNAKNLNAAIKVAEQFELSEKEIIKFSKNFEYA